MNKENKQTEEVRNGEENQPEKKNNFVRLYISIACFAAGVVLFILSFVIKGGKVGVYLLISSMICELAAVTFTNAQKRVNETTVTKVFRYLSYAVMIAGLIVFVIGTTVNASV